MKSYTTYFFIISLAWTMTITMNGFAQQVPKMEAMPALPDKEGWAGMFAGVSNDYLFCMGGANFPGKRPWQGGKKKWYRDIYMLRKGSTWKKIQDKMFTSGAYGVSVSYNDTIIVAGGCNEGGYSSNVSGYYWSEGAMKRISYPDLPEPRANMSGALVGHLLIIAGGSNSAESDPVNTCIALDLDKPEQGWLTLDTIPGPARILPVCAVYADQLYLFSGQHMALSAANIAYSHILEDAYKLSIKKSGTMITGNWEKLAAMPKGVSGMGNPVPVIQNGKMLFWGGVDAVTNLHADPATFPGISPELLWYDARQDTWAFAGRETTMAARVTLPVVYWEGQWVYISGEVKSGIRTNTVCRLKYHFSQYDSTTNK